MHNRAHIQNYFLKIEKYLTTKYAYDAPPHRYTNIMGKLCVFQADLGVDIAYIELKDGESVGHIRCKDAHSARQIQSHTQEGLGFSLLAGKY